MKRMFDKEEIVEIAKEEGGSITVDDELSPTSENPVQNKVIYEALENVGGKLYMHNIHMYWTSGDNLVNVDIRFINSSATAFTAKSALIDYLKTILPTGDETAAHETSALNVNGLAVNKGESTAYKSILTGLFINGSNLVSIWGYYFDNPSTPAKVGTRDYYNLQNFNLKSDFVIEIQ